MNDMIFDFLHFFDESFSNEIFDEFEVDPDAFVEPQDMENNF